MVDIGTGKVNPLPILIQEVDGIKSRDLKAVARLKVWTSGRGHDADSRSGGGGEKKLGRGAKAENQGGDHARPCHPVRVVAQRRDFFYCFEGDRHKHVYLVYHKANKTKNPLNKSGDFLGTGDRWHRFDRLRDKGAIDKLCLQGQFALQRLLNFVNLSAPDMTFDLKQAAGAIQ